MGPNLGGTRTESCEVIAKEDVAAIVFSEKLTRNGWLPRLGRVTRIAEDAGKCGAAAIAGVILRGAGLTGAMSAAGTLRSEFNFGSSGGFDSVAADETESAERTGAKCSELCALSLNFSSEGMASLSLWVAAESLEPVTNAAEVRKVDSFAWPDSADDLASMAGIDFEVSRRRRPSGPRPT